MEKRKCKKCGHEWFKRQQQEPILCPLCKSPNWNKDKKNNDNVGN